MVTTKEIEDDREEYILGYNTCKEDVNKIIDEAFIDSGARKIDFKEELKARING